MSKRVSWQHAVLGEHAVRVAGKTEIEGQPVRRWIGADHIDEVDIGVIKLSRICNDSARFATKTATCEVA